MKLTKRWISLSLAIVMVLSFSGCAADNQPESAETAAPTQAQAAAGTPSLVTEQELTETAGWLMEQVPEPAYGSVGGEWLVLGLARSGVSVPEEYFEAYGEKVASYTAELGGVLHAKKYTE